MFIKLTNRYTHQTVFIALAHITEIQQDRDDNVMLSVGHSDIEVEESLETVLARIQLAEEKARG